MTLKHRFFHVAPWMLLMGGFVALLAFSTPIIAEAVLTGDPYIINSHNMQVDGGSLSDGATVNPISGGTRTITLSGQYTKPSGAVPPNPIAYLKRSGLAAGPCTPADTNCIPSENGGGSNDCTRSVINTTTESYTCEFTISYFADTTTTATSPTEDYSTENWVIFLRVGTLSNNDTDESSNFEYNSSATLDLESTVLNLGAWVPGGGPSTEVAFNLINRGNIRTDAIVRSDNDFSCPGSNTIPRSALRISIVSNAYSSKFPLFDNGAFRTFNNFDHVKQTTIGVDSEKPLYFQFDDATVGIPQGSCDLPTLIIQAQAG